MGENNFTGKKLFYGLFKKIYFEHVLLMTFNGFKLKLQSGTSNNHLLLYKKCQFIQIKIPL